MSNLAYNVELKPGYQISVKLKCSDFRLATPIIYEIMVGDPCCRKCHMGKHREFGQRVAGVTTYTVCCTMASLCIKDGPQKKIRNG